MSTGMTQAQQFMHQFTEDGVLEAGDASLPVVFKEKSGKLSPGFLHFEKGRCVSAEVTGSTPWRNHDGSPLKEVHVLLQFGDEVPHGILIDDGRVVAQYDQGSIRTI